MIDSFNCKETERLYYREYSRKIPLGIQKIALRKLWMLAATVELNALRVPPGNRLEALSGNAPASTVSGLMINGEYALFGGMAMRMM